MFEVKRGEEFGEQDCILSAFIIRSLTGDSIVEPSVVDERDRCMDDSTQPMNGVWVWGVKILYMLKMNYLKRLHIKQAIFYHKAPIYRDFMNDQYSKRLEAKAKNQDIESQYRKDLMNTLFGKNGQKPIGMTETGDAVDLTEHCAYLGLCGDSRKAVVVSFKAHPQKEELFTRTGELSDTVDRQLPANLRNFKTDLHQLTLKPTKEDAITQIGSLVRIASYISTLGQLQLVQAFNKLHQSFNVNQENQAKLKFCYTDTDSIYFDIFDLLVEEYAGTDDQQTLIKLRDSWIGLNEQFVASGQLDAIHLAHYHAVQSIVLKSITYNKIKSLTMFDPQHFSTFKIVPMVDQNTLGAFKIERLSFGGVFTAPKQYTLLSSDIDNPKFKVETLFKGKGVRKEALTKRPGALLEQESGFVEVMQLFTRIFQENELHVDVDQCREALYAGDMTLCTIMCFLKVKIQTICSTAVQNHAVMDLIRGAADRMLCVFVNESAFQASGSFITIRDIAKVVFPSISKRKIEIGDNPLQEGVTSSAPVDLFAFEVQRLMQQCVLSQIRAHVLQSSIQKALIIEQHKAVNQPGCQSQQQAKVYSDTLRKALKVSQLANKLTNRILVVNDLVANQNPCTISMINNRLLQPSEQYVSLQDLYIVFDTLNVFADTRSNIQQPNQSGKDDLHSILCFVYFESQRFWFWPLSNQVILAHLSKMGFSYEEASNMLNDFILTAALVNFARVFKFYCYEIENFCNIYKEIIRLQAAKTKASPDPIQLRLLMNCCDSIQRYSIQLTDPLTQHVRFETIRALSSMSLAFFNIRKQPSPYAKKVIQQFTQICVRVKHQPQEQQATIQMLNSLRVGVVYILCEAVQENFSFDQINPVSEELADAMLMPIDQVERILPVQADIMFSTQHELSKTKRQPAKLVNGIETIPHTGNDAEAILEHLRVIRYDLQLKFKEEAEDRIAVNREREEMIEQDFDGTVMIQT